MMRRRVSSQQQKYIFGVSLREKRGMFVFNGWTLTIDLHKCSLLFIWNTGSSTDCWLGEQAVETSRSDQDTQRAQFFCDRVLLAFPFLTPFSP